MEACSQLWRRCRGKTRRLTATLAPDRALWRCTSSIGNVYALRIDTCCDRRKMCSSKESMATEKSDGAENLGRVGAKTNFDKRGALRVREAETWKRMRRIENRTFLRSNSCVQNLIVPHFMHLRRRSENVPALPSRKAGKQSCTS